MVWNPKNKQGRGNPPEVLLRKGQKNTPNYRGTPILKNDFNKIAGNYIKIGFWHGCFPVNLLHIFRTPFISNTSRFDLDDLDIPKFLTKLSYFTVNILQLFYKCLHDSLPKTCKYELLVSCIFQYQQ